MIDSLNWHSGQPPNIGWWWASHNSTIPTVLRWWNGEYWSQPVSMRDNAAIAAKRAAVRGHHQETVKWRWLAATPPGVSLLRSIKGVVK